ncbi:MAG TPA: TonB-dependent receptor plug domain-containing protein, partial [Steroidobacteraceae bacterium]|nr:TonB-dependent receptor plug domain-containing protein [Steroidobacteraceae bacterium]
MKTPDSSSPTRGRSARAFARRALPLASAISAILAGGMPLVHAQAAGNDSGTLSEVIVTATKVAENMQNIPISMEAISTRKLQQLNIVNLDDYVAFLPGVTTVKSLGQGSNGIGTTHVYMRGVVSGQDGNHSASQPSVGTYFDEMPTTTIDGTIDMHIYDIARIEVLEGPQGTLYGASSEAGTIRIITNKPDPGKFSASYDTGITSIQGGGVGWEAEGYVNLPLSDSAAVRLVGWDEHDPGYISNVSGTDVNAGIVNGQRSFPTWTGATGQTLSNQSSANSDYNTVSTKGGRAALRWNINDHWTVTPMVMGQTQGANGFFGYDPAVGYLKLVHFGPENTQDSFSAGLLTIEGKVHDFDIVYAGGYLTQNTHSIADYADYSYFYDKYYGSGGYWQGNNGQPVEPQEFEINGGHFTKWSNELRITTPQTLPVHGTVGVFAERQVHEIWQDYVLPGLGGDPYAYNTQGLAQSLVMPGL